MTDDPDARSPCDGPACGRRPPPVRSPHGRRPEPQHRGEPPLRPGRCRCPGRADRSGPALDTGRGRDLAGLAARARSTPSSSAAASPGLVAARRLRAGGASVLVVEARDRVGGRLLNHELRDGSVIESGGAFVGPTQDHILAAREGAERQDVQGVRRGQQHLRRRGRCAIPYTGTIPPDPTILADAGVLQARIDQMASEIAVDAPWTHPSAKEWDEMSFATWIRQNTVNPDVRTLLLCYTQAAFGSDGEDFSLLFRSGTSPPPATRPTSAPSSARPAPRTPPRTAASSAAPSSCRCGLAKQLGDRVALNAAVRRIVQDRDARRRAHRPRHGPREAGGRRLPAGHDPRHRLVPDPPAAPQPAPPADADGRADEVRRGLRDAVLARGRPVRLRPEHDRRRAHLVRQLAARTRSVGVLLSFVGGSTWRQVRPHDQGQAAQGRPRGLRRDRRREGARPDRVRRARLDDGALDAGQPDRAPGAGLDLRLRQQRSGSRSAACTGRAPRPRRTGPATWTAPSVRASARRPKCWTGCEGAPRLPPRCWAPRPSSPGCCRPQCRPRLPADRERWDTRVLAKVQSPGYPAFVYAHPNGRVYAGTYSNPTGDSIRSARVRVDPRRHAGPLVDRAAART